MLLVKRYKSANRNLVIDFHICPEDGQETVRVSSGIPKHPREIASLSDLIKEAWRDHKHLETRGRKPTKRLDDVLKALKEHSPNGEIGQTALANKMGISKKVLDRAWQETGFDDWEYFKRWHLSTLE